MQQEEHQTQGHQQSASEWLRSLQARGLYTFTHEQAVGWLGRTEIGASKALRRLAQHGQLVVPRQGFYVIVPAEFDLGGAPPASWFIHDLMAYLKHPYYVGLLTAAGLHGAASQAAQVFQVVTDTPTRPVEVGQTRIEFVVKSSLDSTPRTTMKTPTGSMVVSTPESTAFDLVRYFKSSGHLNNVATVLADLAERLDPGELARIAELGAVEMSVVQRVGHLLDSTGHAALTPDLAAHVDRAAPRPVALRPDVADGGGVLDPRWRVRVNELVEADE